jgi:hypothetical protein
MRNKFWMTVAAALAVASTSAWAANGPVATPKASTAGSLTLVSATQSVPQLDNQIVATLPVTGTTDDGTGDIVCASIFDDGAVKVSQCLTVPVGSTQTLTFTLNWNGSILQGAPGVGLYVYDATSAANPTGGSLLASMDPINPSQFSIVVTNVPTMSEWAMLAMAAMIALAGAYFLRRRSR